MKQFRALISIIIALLFSLSVIGQEISKQDFKFKPLNLNDAISHLHKLTDDSTKIWIKSIEEDDYVSSVQYSQGMWIRNNWRLWKGGELAENFIKMGIKHPNEMSEVIFRTFSRDLKNVEWNTKQLIDGIIESKNAQAEHDQKMKSDSVYRKKIELENEEEKINYFNNLKVKYSVGSEIYTFLIYNCYNNNKVKVYGTVQEFDGELTKIQITNYEDAKRQSGVLKCNDVKNGSVWVNLDRIYFLDEKPKAVLFIATPY